MTIPKICATQIAGVLLLKKVKYFMLNNFEFSPFWGNVEP